MAQKHIQKLLDKKMNRRDFLAHIGAAALTIIGVSGLMKTLLNYDRSSSHTQITNYSSGSYGGANKKLG